MAGQIHLFLAEDHARMRVLMQRSIAEPHRVDLVAYGELRAGLLRHIAMEEKVLFADARARRGGQPLPIVAQLHADHAALASLLVPPPTHALLATIREILAAHDPLEERPGGLYETCEQLAGDEVPAVLARMQAIPEVRAAKHLDEPRVHEHIARMIAARSRSS